MVCFFLYEGLPKPHNTLNYKYQKMPIFRLIYNYNRTNMNKANNLEREGCSITEVISLPIIDKEPVWSMLNTLDNLKLKLINPAHPYSADDSDILTDEQVREIVTNNTLDGVHLGVDRSVVVYQENFKNEIEQPVSENSEPPTKLKGIQTNMDSVKFNELYGAEIYQKFIVSTNKNDKEAIFNNLMTYMGQGHIHVFYYNSCQDSPYLIHPSEELTIEDLDDVYRIYIMKKAFNQPVSENSEPVYVKHSGIDTGKALLSSPTVQEPKPTKTVWDLELHEGLKVAEDMYATRVPGGWKYESIGDGIVTASVFVPYEAQKFDTGCVLCGSSIDKTAALVTDVLDHLNENAESLPDEDDAVIEYVKKYLKNK